MNYIELKHGKYQAHILPELGGNIVYLYDSEQKRELLIGTHSPDELKSSPYVYGMPLLLPPNRIEDGKFRYDGREYQFPVNEKERNNHLHGLFIFSDYQVKSEIHSEEKAELILEYQFDEKDENFAYFPHKMKLQKTYCLDATGLNLTFTVENQSEKTIPMMFAFHTTFPLMNDPAENEKMKIRMSVNARVRLNERLLGTEDYIPMDKIANVAAAEGFSPLEEDMDNVFRMKTFGFRGALLAYPKYNGLTVYEVDDLFRYMVVWNNGQKGDKICIEPQTYKNNGINLPSWEKDGLHLKSGETLQAKMRISSLALDKTV